ncbi:ABC transporter permease [Puerhibacterium sp. TATVAM-FAB25]|uniref:ABC transporter permease n=1 Tax=Puerhibacterium sp. TATVAM-FAB25 TaxID=3093699 RepID=UPI00397BC561
MTALDPGAPAPTAPAAPTARGPRPPRTLDRLARTPAGPVLAVVVLAAFGLAAVAPGLLATHDPFALDYPAALQGPSAAHWFGTDESGRDLYSRVVHGTRESLAIGLGAAAVSLTAAVLLGAVAGLAPRPVARSVDWFLEVLFAFPSLLLALLLIAVVGPSAATQAVAVGVGTAPGYARMVRGQVLQAKGSAYVEAAVALGHPRARIVRAHVLPNALRPLVAIFALSVGQSIVWASGLSFIGLGVAPPSPEWGALLDAGRTYITQAGWLTVIPGLVVVLLSLAATTVGRHLQQALEQGEHA